MLGQCIGIKKSLHNRSEHPSIKNFRDFFFGVGGGIQPSMGKPCVQSSFQLLL